MQQEWEQMELNLGLPCGRMFQEPLVQTRGGDFKIVLEEFIKVKYPTATLSPPDGKWSYADIIMADGFSLAYRVLDAQYWGVPQRRARIYLVADFDGERAGKILFER